MYIDNQGLLQGAPHQASPHFDDRPANTLIDMIVIHGISLPPGEFGQNMVSPFFCGILDCSLHPYFETIKDLKVSAHLFISRQGEITQFVPFLKRAWHAGQSTFAGQTQCNNFSIGIELEGTDEIPYEEPQYQTLAKIIPLLIQAYPAITPERIVGHSDIAPGRKTDPGPAFNWDYLRKLLQQS
ncbi:MAG TPA: 1,6-anhydro-N-acetylmuramyl-L-alanine amidase AmpD [Gammaproteobacteria bacterium]|nr:1,6-anhydro-N-acetylmuramyl-L-alanine amidase AmpD [Gammaproteobacteria bacterium]